MGKGVTAVSYTVRCMSVRCDGDFLSGTGFATAELAKAHIRELPQVYWQAWIFNGRRDKVARAVRSGRSGTGKRWVFEASPEPPDDYVSGCHAQFCRDGESITGTPGAERDADEVRVWGPDGTLIVAAKLRDGSWYVSGSDAVLGWVRYAGTPCRTYGEALDAPVAQRDQRAWQAIGAALSA